MSNAALRVHHSGAEPAVDADLAKAEGRRIVLCGSISFLPQMNHIRLLLDSYRVNAVVPDDVDSTINYHTQERYQQFKREVSLAHMRKIQHHRTQAVLIANFDKRGVRGYIGPNTFAEIAIAFFCGKGIFLLNSIPAQYEDELTAWGAKVIHGDMDMLVGEMSRVWVPKTDQLRLPSF